MRGREVAYSFFFFCFFSISFFLYIPFLYLPFTVSPSTFYPSVVYRLPPTIHLLISLFFSYLYRLPSTSLLFYNYTFLFSGLRYSLILTRRSPTVDHQLSTIDHQLSHITYMILHLESLHFYILTRFYTFTFFFTFLRFYAFYTLSFGPLVLYTFGFSTPAPFHISCLYSLRPTPYSRSLYSLFSILSIPPFPQSFNPQSFQSLFNPPFFDSSDPFNSFNFYPLTFSLSCLLYDFHFQKILNFFTFLHSFSYILSSLSSDFCAICCSVWCMMCGVVFSVV